MSREVTLIGAPTDYGANRRGVDMGPSAIRYAGLADSIAAAGRHCRDAGDLHVPRAEERDPDAEGLDAGEAKFVREVADVSDRLADEVAAVHDADRVPVVLGGDHSVAIGTLRGSAREADVGAIWFDAHGDFNTPESSPSGNLHGMPLAASLGHGSFSDVDWATAPRLREENVVLVGIRDLDDAEREALSGSEATVLTMSDIDQRGISAVTEEALSVATDGVSEVHVSLDLDWLDPKEAPGVGTPVRGGVTYREAHTALETVAEELGDGLRSIELVEVNPVLDRSNETARLATELAASALGKRIF